MKQYSRNLTKYSFLTISMLFLSLTDILYTVQPNMNIGNAYRRASNALCFEKKPTHFAVTVQLDNIKAKSRQKNQSIRPKLYC